MSTDNLLYNSCSPPWLGEAHSHHSSWLVSHTGKLHINFQLVSYTLHYILQLLFFSVFSSSFLSFHSYVLFGTKLIHLIYFSFLSTVKQRVLYSWSSQTYSLKQALLVSLLHRRMVQFMGQHHHLDLCLTRIWNNILLLGQSNYKENRSALQSYLRPHLHCTTISSRGKKKNICV